MAGSRLRRLPLLHAKSRVIHVRPPHWIICFRRRSPFWFFNTFIPGRHKHVIAFGPLPGQGVWLFTELTLQRLDLAVVPDKEADDAMIDAMRDSVVVHFETPEFTGWRWRPLCLCTTIIAQVIGVKSRALRPDRLLRDVLAQGGQIIEGPASEQFQAAGQGTQPLPG